MTIGLSKIAAGLVNETLSSICWPICPTSRSRQAAASSSPTEAKASLRSAKASAGVGMVVLNSTPPLSPSSVRPVTGSRRIGTLDST